MTPYVSTYSKRVGSNTVERRTLQTARNVHVCSSIEIGHLRVVTNYHEKRSIQPSRATFSFHHGEILHHPKNTHAHTLISEKEAVATMKVFLHYEDNENPDLHKTLKITLPKSWKTGPASNLLSQFVESYNAKFQATNPLSEASLHLSIRQPVEQHHSEKTKLVPLCSDDVVIDQIPDRGDVYICHGPSTTKADKAAAEKAAEDERKEQLKNTVACTHFGCQKRFPKGGPYPECIYHKMPPVFHETAKYWACCPQKKAYDWDDFQSIPGCEKGICSEVRDDGQKRFLGGTDLREQVEGAQLKSIDDFNKAQAQGGEAAPVLDRLRKVMEELGIERELFDQVVAGMKAEYQSQNLDESEVLTAVADDLGGRIKTMMKSVAADQLRIK
eukprot:scaffold345_cov134-Cylindrotheca_fusiformis.AAC.80